MDELIFLREKNAAFAEADKARAMLVVKIQGLE